MTDTNILLRAGAAYERAGALDEAVRCYLDCTAVAKAEPLLLRMGRFAELAQCYADGEHVEAGAWLYVHELDSPDMARLLLTELLPLRTDAYPDEDARDNAILDSDIAWIRRFRDDLKTRHIVDPRITREDYFLFLEGVIDDCDPTVFESGEDILQEFLGDLTDDLREFHGEPDGKPGLAANAVLQRTRCRLDVARRGYHPQLERVVRLMRDLVAARCDISEGAGHRSAMPVLANVQSVLAAGMSANKRYDYHYSKEWHYIEDWSVALAELTRRYDQAALVFAASIRGGMPGAAERWRAWSRRVLGVEITVDEHHETAAADE